MTAFSFRLKWFACLILFVCWQFPSWGGMPGGEPSGSPSGIVLRDGESLLDASAYSELQRIVTESIIDPLKKAVLASGGAYHLNQVFWLDSKEPNAFVQPVAASEPQQNKSFNLGLSTGLFRLHFSEYLSGGAEHPHAAENLALGLKRIAGSIAHEFGHTLDFDHPEKYSLGFSQKSEMLADENAVKLLRVANMPVDSFYLAIKRFSDWIGSGGELSDTLKASFDAAVRSHPLDAVRVSQASLLTTLDRFKKGNVQDRPLVSDDQIHALAINLRDLNRDYLQKYHPKNFHGALDELQKFTEDFRGFIESNPEILKTRDALRQSKSFEDFEAYRSAHPVSNEVQEKLKNYKESAFEKYFSALSAIGGVQSSNENKDQGFQSWMPTISRFRDLFEYQILFPDELSFSEKQNGLIQNKLSLIQSLDQALILAEPAKDSIAGQFLSLPLQNLTTLQKLNRIDRVRRHLNTFNSSSQVAWDWVARNFAPELDTHDNFHEFSIYDHIGIARSLLDRIPDHQLPEIIESDATIKNFFDFSYYTYRDYVYSQIDSSGYKSDEQLLKIKPIKDWAQWIYEHRNVLSEQELIRVYSEERKEKLGSNYNGPDRNGFTVRWEAVAKRLGLNYSEVLGELQKIIDMKLRSPHFWNSLSPLASDRIISEPWMPAWHADWNTNEETLNYLRSHVDLKNPLNRYVLSRTPYLFPLMMDEMRATLPADFKNREKNCAWMDQARSTWNSIILGWFPQNQRYWDPFFEDIGMIDEWVLQPDYSVEEKKRLIGCIPDILNKSPGLKRVDVFQKFTHHGIFNHEEVMDWNSQYPWKGYEYLPGYFTYGYDYDSSRGFRNKWIRLHEKDLAQKFTQLTQSLPDSYGELLTQVHRFFPERYADAQGDTEATQSFKNRLLTQLEERSSSLEPSKNLELFLALTNYGPTVESDVYFRKAILPHYESLPVQDIQKLQQIMEEEQNARFNSFKLYSKLVELALNPNLKKLRDRLSDETEVSQGDILQLIQKLDQWMPKSSPEKDQLLEKIAWDLEIQDLEFLKKEIAPRQSALKNLNGLEISGISALSEEIALYPLADRVSVFRYLVSPISAESHAEIEGILQKRKKALGVSDRASNAVGSQTWFRKQNQKIQDSTPLERLPMIELLLRLGSPSILDQSQLLEELAVEFLHYKPQELKLLRAYMRSIPEVERGPTWAYLFAMSQDKGAGLKSLFEVFSTVGVKTGQLASIWNAFGDAVSEELSELKDQANPVDKLDKIAILELLQSQLDPEQSHKIKRLKKILGSASIKTVILADLEDPATGLQDKAVIHVRRPHGIDSVQTNLIVAKKFLDELEKEGFGDQAKTTRSLLSIVEEELQDELNPSREIAKTKRAGEILNSYLPPETVSGWKVKVPQFLQEFYSENREHAKVHLMEFAGGVSFDKIEDPKLKSEAGYVIVDLCLNGLFQNSSLNADPHRGNFIIDPTKRAVYPIDHGQFETANKESGRLKKDDRYHLAQLIQALYQFPKPRPFSSVQTNRNAFDKWAKAVWKKALPLSRNSTPTPADKNHFVRSLTHELLIHSNDEPLITVMNQLIPSAAKPRQEIFGILKGLLILNKENYVEPQVFQSLVAKNVIGIAKEKWPVWAKDWVQDTNLYLNSSEWLKYLSGTSDSCATGSAQTNHGSP